MALEAMDREGFTTYVPTRAERLPFNEYPNTVAMHWDGTYRDRVTDTDGKAIYWYDSDGRLAAPARGIAKHLA